MRRFDRIFVIALAPLGIGATVLDNFGLEMPEGTVGVSLPEKLLPPPRTEKHSGR